MTVWSTFGRRLVALPGVAAFTTFIGLGTAAFKNTGTSGNTVPLLDGANTFSGATTFTSTLTVQPASGNTVIEIGQIAGGVTSLAGFDFHTSAVATDWDVRLLASGDGAADTGTLSFLGGFFTFGGSVARGSPVTKTANFTVGLKENWLINNKSGSSCTVTLPAAASYPGREIMFKNSQAQTVVSASSNVVPRVTAAAGTAILASGSGNWCTMVSDGTNWVIMAGS
jgi:hypothetical protein